MSEDEFRLILQACYPAIERYVNQLQTDPGDLRRLNALYRLILLSADRAADDIDGGRGIAEALEIYGQDMTEDRMYALAS